jgi:hypothetical protein
MIDSFRCVDPLALAKEFWPDVVFYRQQKEIIYSVVENRETVVVAGNELGKDYVAGFIVLEFFLTRSPCKIVTTSAKDDHLRVLWGEIGRFLSTSNHPLLYNPKQGVHTGLMVNQREIRRIVNGVEETESYVKGMVASADTIAAMQGHHATPGAEQIARFRERHGERQLQRWLDIPRSLFVADEASSVPDDYYKMAVTWAQRLLIFGNPWPCGNFFRRAVKGNPKTKDRGGDLAWA